MLSLPTDFSSLVQQYGYPAIVIGTFLEGETVLLLAGFLAHQGYLDPVYVALAAFCGGFAGDEAFFLLARHNGPALLRRFPRLAAGVETMRRKTRKNEIALILGFRFVYGIRNITPAYLGISGASPRLFAPLNAVSAAAWAAVFTAIGYYGGQAMSRLFGRLHTYEPYIIAGFAVAGVGFWIIHRRKQARESTPPDAR